MYVFVYTSNVFRVSFVCLACLLPWRTKIQVSELGGVYQESKAFRTLLFVDDEDGGGRDSRCAIPPPPLPSEENALETPVLY